MSEGLSCLTALQQNTIKAEAFQEFIIPFLKSPGISLNLIVLPVTIQQGIKTEPIKWRKH